MRIRLLLYLLSFFIFLNLAFGGYYFFLKYQAGLSFTCPVPKRYCNKGKVIKIDDGYFGVGYKVPAGSPILAVSDGEIRGGGFTFSYKLGGQRFPTIILRSKTGENEIDYILTGDDYRDIANVRQGDKITIGGEGLIGNLDVNLVVRVRKGGGEIIPLEAKSLSGKKFILF